MKTIETQLKKNTTEQQSSGELENERSTAVQEIQINIPQECFQLPGSEEEDWGTENNNRFKPARTMQNDNKNAEKRMDSPIDIHGI